MRCVRRAAIAHLCLASLASLGACAAEPRTPDGRFTHGGVSLFAEPRGASALVFAGAISPLAYDYDAMAAAGTLGCMKEDRGPSLSRGARLVDAGSVVVDTPRANGFGVGFDRDTGAHVASSATPLFVPGDPVTMRGAGSADVPPFTATVIAPDTVEVTATIDEGGDIALSWPPSEGYVDVVVKTAAHAWPCVFRGERGRATIERFLLADEPAGTITLRTAALRTTSSDAGGWHVSLTVASARTERAITRR